MSFAAPRQDRIGRLRLHVAAGEPAQAPPELRALELHPEGLPAEAIVVVRRLQMARRTAQPASAWRSAARAAVGVALRGAVRPADGPVPANCGVVIFADMAELLACLARDGLRGSLAAHWWWRELFPQGVDFEAVLAAWREEAAWVPAAAAVLQAQDLWQGFLVRWPAHEVPGLRRAREPAPVAAEAGGGPVERRAFQEHIAAVDLGPDRGRPSAAHTLAGRPAGGQPILEGSRAVRSGGPPPSGPRRAGPAEALAETHERDPAQGGASIATSPPAAATPPAEAPAGCTRTSVAASAAARATAVAPSETAAQAAPLAGAGPQHAEPWRHEETMAGADPLSSSAPPVIAGPLVRAAPLTPGSSPFEAPARDAQTFDTGFGGLFYLLNVALHLELYPDFTQPRSPGLALSPWDLLAWLGRRWSGRALLQDPLWTALAQWSGRDPAQEPAAGFEGPANWQPPPGWLRPFEPLPPLTLRRVGGRMLLRHPAGFSLADLDAAAPWPGAWGESFTERPARAARRLDMPQRWLAHLSRYVRARCALALQVPRSQVPAFVLRHRARVARVAEGVTVHLSLADLPLPLRIAGLDRDPGWLPAAGCGVRFVFD